MTRAERSEGFILVETVVAFLILAIALGVAVEAIGQSTRSIVRAEGVAAASLAAAEVMAVEGRAVREPGSWSGVHPNGSAWHLVARRLRDGGPQQLYALLLEVRPPGGVAAPQAYRSYIVTGPRRGRP